MEKLLVLPDSPGKMDALIAFLKAMHINFKSVAVDEQNNGLITDADLIQRIENYERGNSNPVPYSLDQLKAMLNA